ncbi:MAG: hypothetical protein VYC64_03805 [Candidatus Latescibacterota bacterium]|nr:hypothetical protein [Candidatus Latescibacterota bacterium]
MSENSARLDRLLHPEVLAAFDRDVYERDGYWVWDGILTDEGRARWSESLQRVQSLNDAIVANSDWGRVQFAAHGLAAPDADKITPEALAGYRGGSEQMRFQPPGLRDFMYQHGLFDPALVTDGCEWQGMMPEYFPLAYDEFVLDVTANHPQMMDLLGKVLGPEFLIDHVLTLNRPGGSTGRRWHGHPYRQGQYETEDPATGGQSPSTQFLQHQCVRTLCYPEGMGKNDSGGELAVVPGAHLYRTPYMWDKRRTDYDEDFAAGWMRGKDHPATAEPLRIETLDLSPGSMVSFVHHMPHHVGHRDEGAPTRWGLLMAYRTRDPEQAPSKWNEGTPAHWADRTDAHGLMTQQMRRIFEGDQPLTSA